VSALMHRKVGEMWRRSGSAATVPPFRGDTGRDLVQERIGNNHVPRHRFSRCFPCVVYLGELK